MVITSQSNDSAIWLAIQLQNFNTKVYFYGETEDVKTNTMERMKALNLSNIELLDSLATDLKFDYISCNYNLNYVDYPSIFISQLTSLLKPNGGALFRVKTTAEKTNLQYIRQAVNLLNKEVTNQTQQLQNCRNILKSLPQSNIYNYHKYMVQDIQSYGDKAIYNLLLKDVILDLNGFIIEQSENHKFQQRFYANIELANSPFIPNQGPGPFTRQNEYFFTVHESDI